MRKLIGPHVAGGWAQKLDILHQWQPPLALVLQPEVDKVGQLRAACPDAIVIGRFYHDDNHYASNISARPKEFAREIHNEIASNPVTPLLDYVQSNNETNQDWQGIQKLNVYSQEWMSLADQSQLYKCAIMAFSVGNPDLPDKPGDPAGFDGRMLYWQQILPSLNYAQQKNHILLMHAYGWLDMFHPDANWYIYRYERQVQPNLKKLGITNLKYAYGEIGIDRLIVNGRGGYKVAPNTSDEGYVNQTLQWERDLQGEELLLGGTIFTFGDSGGWDSYDITSTNAASMIASHYANHAGDYDNTVDDKDDNVFIPVVGTGGQTVPPTQPLPPVKWDERLTKRGIKLTQYKPKPGEWYWRIVEGQYWEEKEHIFAVTADQNGVRKPDVGVRFWWADDKVDKKTELKPNDRWMTDFDMHAHSCSYGFKVLDGPSDEVWCMGLGSWEQPDWNIHVSYWYEARWVQAPAATVPVTPPPTPVDKPTPRFKLNDTVYTGGYVNLRRTPGYVNKPSTDVLTTLNPNTRIKIFSGPKFVDGLVWWGIIDEQNGWIAESDPAGSVLLSSTSTPIESPNVPALMHPIADESKRILTQTWGVNEAFYKQFLYDGVPLLGHNGIDYGIPVGTQIRAVDAGRVLEIKDGPEGFGLHLLLRHAWGDSLYAHLSKITVKVGDMVSQGRIVAESGNTGTSSGPHLHFGLRLNGYNRKDGYGGYSNPLSFLTPTVTSTNIRQMSDAASKEFSIDPDVFLNLLFAENRFRLTGTSPKGAIGPAQIMPDTFNEWAGRIGVKNINNPSDNIRVGAAYLSWLLKQFNGNVLKALYGYNWGIGRVQSGATPPVATQIYAYSIIHGAEFQKALRKL